jgi:hypothetical protein
MPLREALERLAAGLRQDHGTLVLHAAALREAEISPDMPVRIASPSSGQEDSPLWEAWGLMYVPCPSAPLLTTQRQAENWRSEIGKWRDTISEDVQGAVAEAACFGHDSSGRFRTVGDWVGSARNPREDGPPLLQASDLSPGWTEWEPLACEQPEASLFVIRSRVVHAAGLMLAAAALICFARVWTSLKRGRFGLLIGWLALGALATCWLPASLQALAGWPLIAGLGVVVVWYLVSLFRAGTPPRLGAMGGVTRASAAAAIGLIVSAGLVAWAAPALSQEEFTVLLVPASPEAPDKQTVLAPVELLDRLASLAHMSTRGPSGVMLLRAAYEGTISGAEADFDVVFQVRSFEDKGVLQLPLSGVRLADEVLVDGAQAYPAAAEAPQSGYTIPIEGRGAHVVRLHFRVAVHEEGEVREVKFSAPRLTQSELALNLPAGAVDPEAPVCLGAQRVKTTAEGVRLEADLGRIASPVAVRWRQESSPPQPATLQAREAYLWQLEPGASALKAMIQLRALRGGLPTFEMDVPDLLEVRSVEARPPARSKQGPRLKAWEVTGKDRERRLRLEFQRAVTDEAWVYLEMVPRRPFSATITLPLPRLRDVQVVSSYLAYRTESLEARVRDLAYLTGPRVDEFVDFWKAGGEAEPPHLVAAFAVTRRPDAAPLLRVQLQAPTSAQEVEHLVAWKVDRRQAEFQLAANLKAIGEGFAMAEWDIPPSVTVAHVAGKNVWHWSRTGSRLQVWFQQSTNLAEVRIAGWMTLSKRESAGDQKAKEPMDSGDSDFELPCIRLVGAAGSTTTVRVVPAPGMGIVRATPQNLWPLPDPRAGSSERAYLAKEVGYGCTFQMRPSAALLESRLLTTVESSPGQLLVALTTECRAAEGELNNLEIRLDGWQGDDVRLDAPDVANIHEVRLGPEGRTWFLAFPPGMMSPYRLTLNLSLRREDGRAPSIPRLSVVGAVPTESWLALRGADLAPENKTDLAAAFNLADWQRAWPGEAERLRRRGGTAWKVPPGTNIRLTQRHSAGESAAVRIFLVEQTAAVVGGNWTHQADCWIFHRAGAELSVTLPEGAALDRASVDGAEAASAASAPGQVLLRLPAEAGVCRVRLRWRFDSGMESVDQPILAQPRFDTAAQETQAWTLLVPRGMHAEPADAVQSPAARALLRADAELRLSDALAETARQDGPAAAQLLLAQRRFYLACRAAEQDPALADAQADSSDAIRLRTLRDQNKELAQARDFEKIRSDAERQARSGTAPGDREDDMPDDLLYSRGTPLYLAAGPDQAAPHVDLKTATDVAIRWAVSQTLILLCALAALAVLSFFPRVFTWVRRTWPEQMALVAGLLWLLAFPTIVVLALLSVAILGRLLEIGRWLVHVRGRPAEANGPANQAPITEQA